MNVEITQKKVDSYFQITRKALEIAKKAPVVDKEKTAIVLEMAQCYVTDGEHFAEKNDYVLAYGALNYAHGWLDCGARLGFFIVTDDQLFTVDAELIKKEDSE